MVSKLKNRIRIIGEGITEKHFLQSLRDDYPYVKSADFMELEHANNMIELEKRIEEAAQMGYAKVFCMIDMDNKNEGIEREKYLSLKQYCEYEKREKFFVKHPLHTYFTNKGGSLDNAIKNAKASMVAIENRERNYSYSELGKMIEDLKECNY